jgi:putative nucleotidyltransferase with HDIG domain
MREAARARAPRHLLGEHARAGRRDRRPGGAAGTNAWWRDGSASLRLLVAGLVAVAAAAFVGTVPQAWEQARERPGVFATLLALTLALTLVTVELRAGARVSVAGIGLLTVGFALGPGAALAAAVAVALVHGARTRAEPARTVFNASTLAVAACAATGAFELLEAAGWTMLDRLGPALVAGIVFWTVNVGLLAVAFSLLEGEPARAIWRERLRWLTPYYAAFGPLALAATIAYDVGGVVGLLAFLLPPALVLLSVRRYVERTRSAVDEIALRNRDLSDLFEFAGGLAAQAHDGKALVAYAEREIARLTGTPAHVLVGEDETRGEELAAGGTRVGSLVLEPGSGLDAARWERLRDAILPQLATALESTLLVERVRKTHLDTIAALSRSMEAKDLYTGGHTERVAEMAVALARRLGYRGAELDAIEIGALLHDIGKIGIPERILHKTGPLDETEWALMKQHPVISEYILSGIDFPAVVRGIARWSHERVDGAGYPDGLAGRAIPLAARIVFVADAFDAITSDRPYRPARGTLEAIREIRANAGSQFSAEVVAALEELAREEPGLLLPRDLAARVA